jgi:hypothetical protein
MASVLAIGHKVRGFNLSPRRRIFNALQHTFLDGEEKTSVPNRKFLSLWHVKNPFQV